MTQTILIVEDDTLFRDLLEDLLTEAGYHVIAAEHGWAALRQIKREGIQPALIILYLLMPVMDGWTFAEELRAVPDLDPIPILLLSGAEDLGHAVREIGAVDFITKPIGSMRDFMDCVGELCPAK